jgi:hypothetical protein
MSHPLPPKAPTALWERQLDEGPQAFDAFVIYRDMSGRRSQRAVARALGKSESLISKWASRHDWTGRVAAYDRVLQTNGAGSEHDDPWAALELELLEGVRVHAFVQRLVYSELARRVVASPATLEDLDLTTLAQLSEQASRDLRRQTEVSERLISGEYDRREREREASVARFRSMTMEELLQKKRELEEELGIADRPEDSARGPHGSGSTCPPGP